MVIIIIVLSIICLFFAFLAMNHYNAYLKEHEELVELHSEYAELYNKYSELLVYEEAYKTAN